MTSKRSTCKRGNHALQFSLNRFASLLGCLGLFSLGVFAQSAPSHRAELPPLLPVDKEVALARSAAPEYISSRATIYILKRGGFIKHIEGSNGFTCLVPREGTKGIAPMCFDPEGSQTILLGELRLAELLEHGKSMAEAMKEVDEGYAKGTFKAPRRSGVAYMLSTENHLNDPDSGQTFDYPPHLMIYAPYAQNSDIGASAAQRGSTEVPWILHEGKPYAYIIVVPGAKK
ncbi:MAG TPA: hypothetical protein VLL54_08200 [Pyrinomonadaceae bacterium]|nr:hypothetical protein [Pyrinomonadaceae bacterium]